MLQDLEGGYIKLWRKIFDTDLIKYPEAFTMFLYLVGKAAREPYDFFTKKYGLIKLEKGQLVISIRELAKNLNRTTRTARTALNHLKSTQRVTQQATHKYSVISIVKYEHYQLEKGSKTQQATQQTTQWRHSDDTVTTQEQESKRKKVKPNSNEKNKKKGNTNSNYTDYYYYKYKEKYETSPHPPQHAFINLAALIKKSVTIDVFKSRVDNYFNDPYVKGHSLQGLLSDWDKFVVKRKEFKTSNQQQKGVVL